MGRTTRGERNAMTETLADVHRQVMWNRLISVVEEQAVTLVRTAFSTSVREAGDLSAGVFDRQGRMIAQAVTGTPGHVNAMAEAVGHFIKAIGQDNIFEGDVYITNDPWLGTGHLHDFTVVTPVLPQGQAHRLFRLRPPMSSMSADAVSVRMPTRSTRKASSSRS